MLWVACPWAGAGACQGVAVPVLDLILGEQAVEAPCQEEQEGAWASEAYLDACCQEERVAVRAEAHRRQPGGPGPQHLEAWPLKGALLEASNQVEEQEGNLEVACLAWASQIPEQLAPASEQTVAAEHLQTADVAGLPAREGSAQPGVALRPSRVALPWNPS